MDGSERETVSGIFHELDRELKLRQAFGTKFSEWLDSIFPSFLISWLASGLTALAIYSIFDLVLNVIASKVDGFSGSQVQKVMQTIGWVCVLAGAVIGSISIIDLLKQALPGVEFSGRLADTNTMKKNKIIWVFSAVLLPIVMNVFSNLITSVIGIK